MNNPLDPDPQVPGESGIDTRDVSEIIGDVSDEKPEPNDADDVTDRAVFIGRDGRWAAGWALRFIIFVVAAYIAGKLLGAVWAGLLPILLAILVTTVLWPVSSFLRRKASFPAALAALATLVGFFAVFGGIIAAMTPIVRDQGATLVDQASEGVDRITEWAQGPPLNLDLGEFQNALNDVVGYVREQSSNIASGVFTGLSARFFTLGNFTNILKQISHYAILAAGVYFAILLGGIDISVGSVLAFSGAMSAIIISRMPQSPISALLAVLAALLIGLIAGWLAGLIMKGSGYGVLANIGLGIVGALLGGFLFGLSQLHQLRGRVGRGSVQSYCFLLGVPSTPEGKQRIELLRTCANGFEIAEADLELRGPGEYCGVRQAGLPDFRAADLLRDTRLLDLARRDAAELLESDPALAQPEHAALSRAVQDLEGMFV